MPKQNQGKTIQIFLPSGRPSGIRIAEITTRILQAVAVPRTQLSALPHRKEAGFIGVYFLFGDAEEEAKPQVYIGQTEDLVGRFKAHHDKKDFWDTAVFLISRTNSFTQAHIRFLEWEFIRLATDAGRYKVLNGNSGSKPYVTEAIEADLYDVIETSHTLMGALGYPVLESVSADAEVENKDTPKDTFTMRSQSGDWDARMIISDEGYVVLKGSKCRKKLNASLKPDGTIATKRQRLLKSGVLLEEENHYVFSEDYLFKSPSGAAGAIYGGAANGWKMWKTDKGRTLDKVERQDVETNGG